MHSELIDHPPADTVALPAVDVLMDDGAALAAAAIPPGTHKLPVVALPDNPALAAAVQKLVEQKERLDLLARDPKLAGLLPPEWLGQGGRAVDVAAFVQGVLPFLQAAERGETAPMRLPLRHVLGDSGRWSVADVAEPQSLAWLLASDDRATVGSRDHADALLIGALGLAWMQEGRSRPGFLRAMGVDTLAARTTMLGYPPPEELALYEVTAHGQREVWCVHGRRRLRPLPAPWLSVPLLVAHGVKPPQPWPSSYPAIEAVARELATARQGRALPEISLPVVVRKIAEDASGDIWQPVSLLQLGTWVPRWPFFLAIFVGLPSLLLVTAALALPGAIEAATVAASLGFAAGAIGALAAPWVYARRRHLS